MCVGQSSLCCSATVALSQTSLTAKSDERSDWGRHTQVSAWSVAEAVITLLQGISGPQKFQIHKSYGPQDRLPSAHTCFNQLDILEYESKEQLSNRLMVAIHEGSEGFGFG